MDLSTKKSIIKLRLEGQKFSDIARKFDISKSLAHSVTQSFMLEWEVFFELFKKLEELQESKTEMDRLTAFLMQEWLYTFIDKHDKSTTYSHDYYKHQLRRLSELKRVLNNLPGYQELFESSLSQLIESVQHDAARAEYNTFQVATPANISQVSLQFDKEEL